MEVYNKIVWQISQKDTYICTYNVYHRQKVKVLYNENVQQNS